MNRTWLLIDTNYLCHRAFHVFNGLTSGAAGTGVVFGVLKDVQTLMDQHATSNIAFCFDHGKGLREQKVETYKQHRRERVLTEEEEEAYRDMRKQVRKLRETYLPGLGFKNVFFETGYEADDVIASVVGTLDKKDEAVIVSADKDLFQLLSKRVCIWNPTTKVCLTKDKFQQEWGIPPWRWPSVKALAGCQSDGVVGLKWKTKTGKNTGVGEKGAADYFAGTLADGDKKDRINEFLTSKKYATNLGLVKLPYPGCPAFALTEDKVSRRAWESLTKKLGMRSIADRVPGARRSFGLGGGVRG